MDTKLTNFAYTTDETETIMLPIPVLLPLQATRRRTVPQCK